MDGQPKRVPPSRLIRPMSPTTTWCGLTQEINRQLGNTCDVTGCTTAIDSIAHRLHSGSTVLLLSNGLGFAGQVHSAHPKLALYQGTTTEGAFRIADLHVRHAGVGVTRIGATGTMDAPDWFHYEKN